MENPATWGAAEHAVNAALDEFDRNSTSALPTPGLSLVRHITDNLRSAGLLEDSSLRDALGEIAGVIAGDYSPGARDEIAHILQKHGLTSSGGTPCVRPRPVRGPPASKGTFGPTPNTRPACIVQQNQSSARGRNQ